MLKKFLNLTDIQLNSVLGVLSGWQRILPVPRFLIKMTSNQRKKVNNCKFTMVIRLAKSKVH